MAEPLVDQLPGGSGPAAGLGRRLPRALTPFRHRGYRRLALALLLSTFASGVWVVAQIWEVIRIGGGPAQLSIVSMSGAIGVFLPALLAGVVADRMPQKHILLVVATVELLGMGVIGFLSLSGITSLWHLAVVAFCTGVGMAFYFPAYSAWLPSLVPPEDLMAVNGFEGMIRPTVGQALGPAVAGAVVGAVNPGSAILIAAAACAVGLVALTAVPLTPVRRELEADTRVSPVRAALGDIAEGFRYLTRTRWLLATLLFASLMILVMMGPFEVLVPFLIKDRLGGGASQHAWVMAAFGVGGALGSMTMASMRMPRHYLSVMTLLWGVACLPLIVMGMTRHVLIVVAAAFVLGALFGAPMVIWGTLLQRRVPPSMLGRVSSLDFFVSMSLMPVSMALAGPVAEWVGVRTTFLVAGTVPVVLALFFIVWGRLPADEVAHPLRDEEPEPESCSLPEGAGCPDQTPAA
ncbi:MAG: MFS transporter [Propionibacteriaceae bacterium]